MGIFIAASAAAVAILIGSLDARAFTLEPVGGNDSGGNSRFADPDERYDTLTDPSNKERNSAQDGSTFTYGTTGSNAPNRPAAVQVAD